ncbi:glycosyltransferase [Alphaproteobacteria bacterium]|nr:glycosyltransferase [Alphaproteobacteria bacterium]
MLSANKVSVVIINLNNGAGLRRTLTSVIDQDYPNLEILVIDGGSTDDSLTVMQTFDKNLEFKVSEPDDGIYDAMNKGYRRAVGDWVCFMNSGDCFYEPGVLSKLNLRSGALCLYGKNENANGVVKPRSEKALLHGEMFACHQSMLFNRGRLGFRKNLYNTNYRINSDLDLSCKISKEERSFEYSDNIISITEPGGVSQRKSWRKRFEWSTIVFYHFGPIVLVKAIFRRVFSKIMFMKIN